MKVLIILGAIALGLILLSFVRVGALVEYSGAGLSVRIKVGPLRFTAYPRGAGGKKKKRKKKEPDETQAPKGGSLALLKRFLPLVGEAAGRVKRKIHIDVLHLDVVMAASDPAAAAMAFGGANAVIGMLWPIFEQNFHVEERRIRTAVDFDAEKPVVSLFVQATLTIGQAVALGGWMGIRLLKLLMKRRAEDREAKSDSGIQPKQKVGV